jgi:hypothetical protein
MQLNLIQTAHQGNLDKEKPWYLEFGNFLHNLLLNAHSKVQNVHIEIMHIYHRIV